MRWITTTALIGSMAMALAIGACAESNNDASGEDTHARHDHGAEAHDDADAGRTDLYEGIEGEIVALPGERADGDMRLKHEHIPGFKNEAGEVPVTPDGIRGMKSMVMPFPLADGVSVEGYETGDKVRFSFRVNWDGGAAAWEITQIEKLDPATEIDYSNASGEDAEP